MNNIVDYLGPNFGAFNVTQFSFWILILVVFVLSAIFQKHKTLRFTFISFAGLFFYYETSGVFVLLLLLNCLVIFGISKIMTTSRNTIFQKISFLVGILTCLALLVLFKYAFFFTSSYNALFHTKYEFINSFLAWSNHKFNTHYLISGQSLTVIGLSFYTFQSIAYLVDVRKNSIKTVLSFSQLIFFLCYFPKLLMGPIVKSSEFIAQMNQSFVLEKQTLSLAIVEISRGLIKKIVFADFIYNQFVSKVFNSFAEFPGWIAVLAVLAYSLQIYADFSGFCDIFRGISRLLGFPLQANFNSPYKARNVGEFWRRWHVSLGDFWRNYLYIPLGGNRKGSVWTYVSIVIIALFLYFISGWNQLIFLYGAILCWYVALCLIWPSFIQITGRDFNLLIVMILGGLWHGASLNFVIWGTLNGLALVIFQYWKKIKKVTHSSNKLLIFWQILFTFLWISFTRIWFVFPESAKPLAFINQIMNEFEFTNETVIKAFNNFGVAVGVFIIGMLFHLLPNNFKNKQYRKFENQSIAIQGLALIILIVALMQIADGSSQGFIYFKF